MIPLSQLEKSVREGLAYLKAQEDVEEGEVFVAANGVLLARLNYTSHIPCNGVEEPKSVENYGVGVQAVFKGDELRRAGFGSETSDISIEGVKSALEKARDGAVADPEFKSLARPMAAASGLPVAAAQYGLLALIAVTTVIGLQTVGIVLVVALLITPAATAQLLTRRLPPMMAVGAVVGALSSLVGLYIAYHADVSASAAIVLTATGFFFLAFLFAPGRGLLWQRRFVPAQPA